MDTEPYYMKRLDALNISSNARQTYQDLNAKRKELQERAYAYEEAQRQKAAEGLSKNTLFYNSTRREMGGRHKRKTRKSGKSRKTRKHRRRKHAKR